MAAARIAAVIAAFSAGLAITVAEPARAAPADPRLAAVESWAFGIGSGNLRGDLAGRFADYDLVVLDAQEARPHQVATLRVGGTIVLGYLSLGTIEPFRPWYKRLKRFRLRDRFDEFDEYYARVRAKRYQKRIIRIARRQLRKGFDGLFLDNTDMIETHRGQKRGMRKLVRRLSRLVDRAPGRYLFSQNGASAIGAMLRYYDGWNREDATWTYSFSKRRYRRVGARAAARARAELARIGASGLLTLATDYTTGAPAATAESVANACSVGAIPFVSDIGLRRISSPPLRCP